MGFLDNCRRGRGGPRPGKENIEQHNKDNYDRYNRENALGRRQLRRRKRHKVAEEAPARGRQRSPRSVAGGAACGAKQKQGHQADYYEKQAMG